MSLRGNDVTWKAAPHTIAKIRILEAYLVAWFQILGKSKYRSGQDLTYIDGFAGPGKYTNFARGSPVAALVTAKMALSRSEGSWQAGKIRCCFIEESPERAACLNSQLEPFLSDKRISPVVYTKTFTEGLEQFKTENPHIFARQWPVFAFVDPCGATGVPLSDVVALLGNPTAEVLLNFDADGIGRIYKAAETANHERLLNEIYGDQSWKVRFGSTASFDALCRAALELYKTKLLSVGKVKYVFPFEMRTKRNTIGYFLLFASSHPLGLEKMKEAMKQVDQNGEYCFSDARVGQGALFRFDEPARYAKAMQNRFAGRSVDYAELLDFALLETPFTNPKNMLKQLEGSGSIEVNCCEPRRKGTFSESKLISIRFKE